MHIIMKMAIPWPKNHWGWWQWWIEVNQIDSDYHCNVCAKSFKHESEVKEHQVKHGEVESVVWLIK